MRHEIVLSPEAISDLRNLRADERAKVEEALEKHLRHQPARASRTRIKRLRGLSRPELRLRVEETRDFYDVEEGVVEVLAIIPKSRAQEWLERAGESDEGSPSV